MKRFYEFRDAEGIPGMCGQQLHGATARDTTESSISAADKHLLHHVRVFGWTDVVAYHPDTPMPQIMKRANDIRKEKGMDPVFSDEDIKAADPKYAKTFTIHRYDAQGKIVPVTSQIGAEHTAQAMAKPIIGATIATDDPANPTIKHAAITAPA
jgi:hypothetical protein